MTFPDDTGSGPYTDEPAGSGALAAALAALDSYDGTGSPAEHAAEAARLGGENVYRMRLANALLGVAQLHAILAEGQANGDGDALMAAHAEQLRTCGVLDPGTDDVDVGALMEFLRWQTLRVAGPLRQAAGDPASGPVVLAAAHTTDGLQRMLGAIAAGQALMADPSPAVIDRQRAELATARQALTDAITNLDLFENMLASVNAMFGGTR